MVKEPIPNEILRELWWPFHVSEHSIREGYSNDGKTWTRWFVWVEWGHIIRRLERVVPGCWETTQPVITPFGKGGVMAVVGLTIGDWTRYYNGASMSEDPEQIKGAVTDAYRRAASQWGIARYIYDMPMEIWVPYYDHKAANRRELQKQAQQLAWNKFLDYYFAKFDAVLKAKETGEPSKSIEGGLADTRPPEIDEAAAAVASSGKSAPPVQEQLPPQNGQPAQKPPPPPAPAQKPPAAGKPKVDDVPWCEWCGQIPSAPGEPCQSCVKLGAKPGDGLNKKTKPPVPYVEGNTYIPWLMLELMAHTPVQLDNIISLAGFESAEAMWRAIPSKDNAAKAVLRVLADNTIPVFSDEIKVGTINTGTKGSKQRVVFINCGIDWVRDYRGREPMVKAGIIGDKAAMVKDGVYKVLPMELLLEDKETYFAVTEIKRDIREVW